MKEINTQVYPGWKVKAVTFSYDDGRVTDRKLAEIFDKYGAKCTFNLCSGHIGESNYLGKSDVVALSERHEIACHSKRHFFLERLPNDLLLEEIRGDKNALEDITGKPIIGMAYPYGTYSAEVIRAAKLCGIQYSRTTQTGNFSIPQEYMEWHPTCHHRDAERQADRFLSYYDYYLLYIWGHGHEFENDGNWDLLEDILKRFEGREDIYFATNGEIYDYFNAVKSLRVSHDGRCVYNPTATDVYAKVGGEKLMIRPGKNFL